MKLCFVADVHVGNPKQHGGPTAVGVNQRGGYVLAALHAAVRHANSSGATLVVLGDLFDSVKPEPQLVARVQDIFSEATTRPVCLLGNHEMVSAQPGDNSLAPLRPVAFVADAPMLHRVKGLDLMCVPFRPGVASEWLPEVVKGVAGSSAVGVKRVLALHLGVADASTAAWLKDSHDAVSVELVASLAKQHKFDAVFAGNWHDRRLWSVDGVHIEQVGALHPTGWNNPGTDYGYCTVYDGKAAVTSQLAGPRFVTVSTVAEVEKLVDGPYYVRSNASEAVETEIISRLEVLKGMGKVVAWEHDRAVDGEQVAAARTAVADARAAAKNGGDVLAEYINSMPLQEGVDRVELLAVTKQFLGGSL